MAENERRSLPFTWLTTCEGTYLPAIGQSGVLAKENAILKLRMATPTL
jgi:hypothetical protein